MKLLIVTIAGALLVLLLTAAFPSDIDQPSRLSPTLAMVPTKALTPDGQQSVPTLAPMFYGTPVPCDCDDVEPEDFQLTPKPPGERP